MTDLALRSCSVGARGLWMDMLCLMHQGSPYGYLKVNLTPILPANLASHTGATLQNIEGWLAELEGFGVFIRDESGAIFSKRMVRDEKVRAARAAGGFLGGNPNLVTGNKGSVKVGSKVNLHTNLQPTPSSSSSSSTSKANTDTCAQADLCRAAIDAGITGVNHNHPDLIAALAEGVTADEVATTAAELIGRGKNQFPYLLATLRNRRAEAKPVNPNPGPHHANHPASRNLSAVERVKAANERAEQRAREQRDPLDAEHRVVA